CRAVRDAVADPPGPEFVPLSVEETKPLTLACGPLVVAWIFTLTVQELPAATVAPVVCPKLRVEDPVAGAQEGPPPQVVPAAGVAATIRPAGRLSVNFTPVRE